MKSLYGSLVSSYFLSISSGILNLILAFEPPLIPFRNSEITLKVFSTSERGRNQEKSKRGARQRSSRDKRNIRSDRGRSSEENPIILTYHFPKRREKQAILDRLETTKGQQQMSSYAHESQVYALAQRNSSEYW